MILFIKRSLKNTQVNNDTFAMAEMVGVSKKKRHLCFKLQERFIIHFLRDIWSSGMQILEIAALSTFKPTEVL
ncbi:hypothetical protein D3C87_1248650 [compost metagenome]